MTFSVVARCPTTGLIGVAAQTRHLAVGSTVPWARAGVGAVTSQGWQNPLYGYGGLTMMQEGVHPEAILEELLGRDERPQTRQVAMVNADGSTAVHTGTDIIGVSEAITLPGAAFAANLMTTEGVPHAMAQAWEEGASLEFVDRLAAVLRAAQRAGGDLRGEQSAAIRIVGAERVEGWDGTVLDLRVDDHQQPLDELERLLHLYAANSLANYGDLLQLNGEIEGAIDAFDRAQLLLPGVPDVVFWQGVMLARAGRQEAAREVLRAAFSHGEQWRELFVRLCDAGQLGEDSVELRAFATL